MPRHCHAARPRVGPRFSVDPYSAFTCETGRPSMASDSCEVHMVRKKMVNYLVPHKALEMPLLLLLFTYSLRYIPTSPATGTPTTRVREEAGAVLFPQRKI